jgi:hypothetical protein
MTAAAENTEVNDLHAQAIIDALPAEKLTELLSKKGFVVKPETDYQTEIETARKTADSEATKRNYTVIEQSIFELTQVAKKPGEKVDQYQKRAFAETQSKNEIEKKEVIEQVAEVSTTQLDMIKSLQTKLATMEARDKQREIDAFKDKANGLVEGAFSTIKLNVLDEADLNSEREEKEIIFKSKYEAVKGSNNTIVWKNKATDDLLLDTNGLPMNPEAIIKQYHSKWLAKEGNQQTGLGLKGKTEKPALQYGSTRDEISGKISEEAKKRGVAVTSPEMIKLRKEAYAAAGIPT